jgi:regulator of cell morphogenesis and NO signaling
MNTKQLTEEEAGITIDYLNSEVLENTGKDVCRDNNRTFKEVNHKAGEEQLKVIVEPFNVTQTVASGQFDTWDTDSIIDHIINTHHRFAKENAVIIYDLSQKVAHRHNKNHPEFATLAAEIFFFLHDLLNHMMKEEKTLFPNIRQLMKSRKILGSAAHTTFGAMGDSVRLIQEHHGDVQKELNVLRQLTNNYRLPEDACNLCDHLFKKLQEFETDLLTHVDLESNILFPKAIAIEEAVV